MGSWSNIYHYQEFQSNIKESKILRLGNNNCGEHLDSDSPKNTTNDGSGGGKITGQKVSWLIKTSERFANQNQFMTFRVPVLTLDFYFTKIQEEELESLLWTQSSDEFNGRILRSSILWARGIVAEIMTFCFPSCLKPYH